MNDDDDDDDETKKGENDLEEDVFAEKKSSP
jgi:hypothetical protein